MNGRSVHPAVNVPHCHRTRSTAGWQRGRRCAHKRRCCCRRPHTHSLGNTPAGKRDSHVTLKAFLWCPFPPVPIIPTRRGPARDTPGRTRCVPPLRTPPGSPSSSCCCSSSPPGDTNETAGGTSLETGTSRAHHHGPEGHAVHLRLADVHPGDVQDGGTEVDVGHQHL